MENLTMPSRKGWLSGLLVEEQPERKVLPQEEYEKEMEKIRASLESLNKDMISLYERSSAKNLGDAVIYIHTINEMLS